LGHPDTELRIKRLLDRKVENGRRQVETFTFRPAAFNGLGFCLSSGYEFQVLFMDGQDPGREARSGGIDKLF
jgi:hypothetical protein